MLQNVTRVLEGNGMGGLKLDRDRWRALVDTDLKAFGLLKMRRIPALAQEPLVCD
jgi:hypothetical protein